MHIIYLGKHNNSRSNDDEGAITRSLLELGHTVKLVPEQKFNAMTRWEGDFVLFNHYPTPSQLSSIKIPKVFWCFDRIEWDDPILELRNHRRREWIRHATDVCDIGFMTDGDWVEKDRSSKLVWLTQGFNQYLTSSKPRPELSSGRNPTILFTGGRKGGGQRESFVWEMKKHYPHPNRNGPEFIHYDRGLYGKHLADAVALADIVVAPDSPITNKYWSNRLYLMLGLGAFLLHPYSSGVADFYLNHQDLIFYENREHLHSLIQSWLEHPLARQKVAQSGQFYTMAHHTYKHRCAELLRIAKERLNL